MEEKKEESTKLTYEQLEKIAMQLQQRLVVTENKLKSIDYVSMRLTWLFRVVESKAMFSSDFYDKCVKEIEELLTPVDLPEGETISETKKE